MKLNHLIMTVWTVCALVTSSYAQTKNVITIQVNKPTAEVQPTMWGVFFEDINMGADGGIYAELVKNRSFEFFKPMMGWTVQQKKIYRRRCAGHQS